MLKQLSDPGLGEKYYQNKNRIINKDGSFNSKRKGMKWHLYHYYLPDYQLFFRDDLYDCRY